MHVRSQPLRGTLPPIAADAPARRGAAGWRAAIRWLAGLALAGFLIALWAVVIEPDRLVVRDVTIATGKWPADVPPLTIAVMADLHAGALHIDAAKIDSIVDRINAARPDVIVLLGDFLIQGVPLGRVWSADDVARHLARLRAPQGVYAVLGNHDWYAGGLPMWRALEAVGIPVLENRALPLPGGRIWIAGIADDTTRSPDPLAAVAPVPEQAAVIALAHDPAVFAQVPDRVALTLAGHTHGGQVVPPLIGPLFNASRAPLRHSYGHVHEDGKDLFVSAGIGTSMAPVRFNAPPEIVFIRLGRPPATAPAAPG